MRVLIIGGVAAGASTAARLRRLNEDAEIVMFEKGPFVSFSNCCLPYHIGGHVKTADELILMTPDKFLKQYNIQAMVNSEVVAVDTDTKSITVLDHTTNETRTEKYDKLMVAPGAKPILPPFEGLDLVNAFPLKTVPDVINIMNTIEDNSAKKAVVIGGGFIGVEAAENLKERGLDVTLIEGSDQIIRPIDLDMVSFLHNELRRNGVNLVLGDLVDKFKKDTVVLKSGLEIEADVVVLAIGVTPDTAFLKGSKIKMNERGYIITDDNYMTSEQDVYAGGDAILIRNQLTNKMQPLALAGPANKQGRYIADAMMGRKVINKGYIQTSVLKVFDLNAASTGLNEDQIKQENIEYDVAYSASPDRVGIMPGATPIMMKLLFEKNTGKVLGAQAISKGAADKRIDVVATAIKGNMDIFDLTDLELSYAPTFGTGKDVVNKTGYIATNLFQGLYKQVRYSEVYDLIKQNAQIVDVREDNEFDHGSILSAISMPMSRAREELTNLDKNKPVYVFCKIGQRSYNMTMLLQSKGFDVYNIAGAYDYITNHELNECALDSNRTKIVL